MEKLIFLLITILCLAVLVACSQSDSPMPDLSATHIGYAVLREPVREASDDIYRDSGIIRTDDYAPYTKKMVVYGITFIAKDEIPDAFLLQVAQTTKEIFAQTEDTDPKLQEAVLQNMYKYHAVLPVVSAEPSDLAEIMKTSSICDIIMNTSNHQAMEVVEHILHTVTDVGLHYALTDEFGLTQNSSIYKTMQEAISNQYYNVESYQEFPEGDIKERILIQEYAYWLITSAWNLQEAYGLGEDEWTLQNAETLKATFPSAYQLYEAYLPQIMSPPQESTLQSFGS